MTLSLTEQLEHLAKRGHSDGEIAEIGKVLSLCNLPRDERERKWEYLRPIRKARLVELGLKAKKCASRSSEDSTMIFFHGRQWPAAVSIELRTKSAFSGNS